ncbi:SPFH domain-containing protein [Alkalicella caledoniensis]|uniref:SPFH domain-containing protein n=1 Tax=Alkalicella caledoniensis TaxID=2731377 RepID=A0A7G9WCZ2_ALKCA|nr:SPFH domain-containing protein [Alkalicella caledoniensis]QNO16554.1 SPFH domain-containing protein [Alkalicella caledoniensis]
MAVVDVIRYDGNPDVFAWKHPSHELGNWTQLIVNESQEAILFKGGQALDLFTAGRHTLSTNNIPLLSKLVNLPFGGNSPFVAEVWYINKRFTLDVKWGTKDPIQLQDPQYKIFVPVRSFGQFGIQINDSRKFLVNLVGTMKSFDKTTLNNYFRGVLTTKIKDHISSYLVHKKISVLDINAYIDEISEHIQGRVAPTFEKFGISVENFYVNSINIPENDPGVAKLKDALARRAEMDIIGYNYQQQRSFDTLESAARNEGSGASNIMGAGIGMGMGLGIGGGMGNAMGQVTQNLKPEGNQTCVKCNAANPLNVKFCNNCGNNLTESKKENPAQNTCASCSEPMSSKGVFCPHCGSKHVMCPDCGKGNLEDSKVCRACGNGMPVPCNNCGESVQSGVNFCPNCGNSMVLRCGGCSVEVKPGQKFCHECGNVL